MTAKEFLEEARRLENLIESTVEMLDRLSNIQSVQIRVSGGSNSKSGEIKKALQRVEVEERLTKYITELEKYRKALANLITDKGISYLSKIIIQQRYFLNKTWKEVAGFIKYDVNYTKRELNEELINEVEKRREVWEKFIY